MGTRGNSPRSHKHFKCQFECQPGAVGLCGLSCQPPLMCPHTLGGPCPTKTPKGATTRRVVCLVYWLVVHPKRSGVPRHPPQVPQGPARLAGLSLLFILNLFPMKAWGETALCAPKPGDFHRKSYHGEGAMLGPGLPAHIWGTLQLGSWGAGGSPLFRLPDACVPLGELVCQCVSRSTHGGCATAGGHRSLAHACARTVAGRAVCVLPACVCTLQACSAARCSLFPRAPHALFAYSLQAPPVPCANTAGSLLRVL